MTVRLRTKYTWKDVEDGYNFPADEARLFIDRVKPYLVGKELKQILIQSFDAVGKKCNETETFTEWSAKRSPNDIEWVEPLILRIGDEQLEISLWMPDRYVLSINNVDVQEIVDADKVPLISLFKKGYVTNSSVFYDISACYKDIMIGQKIKDIALISHYYNEERIPEDEYIEKIAVTLENSVLFDIYDGTDYPTIGNIRDSAKT